MSTETPNEVKRLNDLFVTAVNAQSNNNVRNYKKEWTDSIGSRSRRIEND